MDGVPIVQLLNQDSHTTQVWRYRGGDWVQEGNNVDTGLSNDTQLAIYQNHVYVSYLSESGTNKYTMVKEKTLQLTSADVPSGAVSLTGIRVIPPSRTSYHVGDALDMTGMQVKAVYSDMTEETLAGTAYTVTGADTTSIGTKTVTVTYRGYTDQFQINVVRGANPEPDPTPTPDLNPTPNPPSTPASDIVPTQQMFRLYNPNSGEHFYTASVVEREHLSGIGWQYEGVGWTAPVSGNPVYRMYNPNAGDHHYTMSATERDQLVRFGWKYEGIGFYSDSKQSVPLYRSYNPNAQTGSHNYTTNQNEDDFLSRVGWKKEGIAWYGAN